MYKGMRLFTPSDMFTLKRVLNAWRSSAEKYGYNEYVTPIIDEMDIYTDKTSEEIVREQTYNFTDRGKRKVLLRPELTPGLTQMVLYMQKNRKINKPLKLFSIGNVFRYEKPQKGRSREHTQFNLDIFGEENIWAEVDIIETAFDSLENMGFEKNNFIIYINDRKSLEQNLKTLKIKNISKVIKLLDKRDKMEKKKFIDELQKIEKINISDIDRQISKTPENVKNLLQLLPTDIDAKYNPGIVRGFNYYTDIIFEIYAKKGVDRSIAGGGRYNKLIETYGGSSLPAVGIGMGDTTLLCILNDKKQENNKIVFITQQEDITNAYFTCRDIRKEIDISFLGYIKENKLTDAYKKYEKENVKCVVIYNNGDMTVRNLEKKENIITTHLIDKITSKLNNL